MPLLSLRSIAKVAYYEAKIALGSERRAYKTIQRDGLVPVLNFHRVSPEPNPFWDPLAPKLFDDLTAWLLRFFRPVTFAELARGEWDQGGKPPCVISFDDGFLDFMEHAMPILKKHGVRANMNVIPKYSSSGTLPWNFVLYDFLERGPGALIREINLPGIKGTECLDTPARKQRFGFRISSYFKNRPCSEREELWGTMQRLIDRWGKKPRDRMMNTAEIRDVALFHEIGVHSFGHDSMGFESDEFFMADLEACRSYFRDKLALPLTIYSFPNGSYRQRQIDLLLSGGLRHVLLVKEECSHAGNKVHPRLNMTGSSMSELMVKTMGHGSSLPY